MKMNATCRYIPRASDARKAPINNPMLVAVEKIIIPKNQTMVSAIIMFFFHNGQAVNTIIKAPTGYPIASIAMYSIELDTEIPSSLTRLAASPRNP